MPTPAFAVYDADSHLYEPEEAFTRHLPERFRRDFYFVDVAGRRKLVIAGMLSEFIPNPTFAVVAAPGSHEKWYRADNPEGKTLRELGGKPIRPPETWRTGAGRIALLDEQGVHASLVFPTLASAIEERLGARGEATAALFHSLNQWTVDEWGFAREGRLFSVPFISLTHLELALAELDFVIANGARAVAIRPAPVPDVRGSRSFGFPEYDPFWARVADAGLFVCLHASDSGYDRVTQWWTGGEGNEFLAFERNTFQAMMDLLGRAISDSIAALICHGVFERHPKVRVASIENGAEWVPPLLARLDRAHGQMPRAFKVHPREQFERHVYVAPFYEDDLGGLRRHVPVERLLFGSDYPHPEGAARPLDYLEDFRAYAPDEIEKIFSSNLKGLLEGRSD
ncbi:MAG TPA: amidohydrolase family protein [Myxococcota bacterium]|nr:amidohydrolase family protein [Myxococcota bacterium]